MAQIGPSFSFFLRPMAAHWRWRFQKKRSLGPTFPPTTAATRAANSDGSGLFVHPADFWGPQFFQSSHVIKHSNHSNGKSITIEKRWKKMKCPAQPLWDFQMPHFIWFDHRGGNISMLKSGVRDGPWSHPMAIPAFAREVTASWGCGDRGGDLIINQGISRYRVHGVISNM